jgi:fibro-slime domain-containing protein
VGLAALAAGGAQANTLSATYYGISSSDPSYNTMCCSTSNNEVQNTLGPDGLPLYNPSYSGPAPNSADLFGPSGSQELTWWSPTLNSHVTQIGTGTVTLPINDTSNFYPCVVNGTYPCDDYQAGLAAVYSGTLSVPQTEQVSFSIGADDSAFAYLDGNIVCDLGGVHAYTPGTCVTPFNISPGNHTLDLFFVDMNTVQSGLSFDINTQDVTTTTDVPEPSTLLLAAAGLAGLALRRRWRRSA